MRFDFEGDEFPGAFVEYTDAWSVGDKRRVFEVKDADFYALLRRKVTALHLPALEGEPLDAPAMLELEHIDRLDGRLWDWLKGTLNMALVGLGDLGEAMRRRLYSSGKKTEN